MFKFLGKVISFLTYIILMITGIALLLGFLFLALFFVIQAQVVTDWINDILLQIDTTGGMTIPEWVSYAAAIPFLIFSLLGLSIILLTQRTARLGRHINKAKKVAVEAKKVQESDYGSMTKSELIELFEDNDVEYKNSWSKAKLVEVAEKKIE